MRLGLAAVLVLVCSVLVVEAVDWNYDESTSAGPSLWHTIKRDYYKCGPSSQAQSPINIIPSAVVRAHDKPGQPLRGSLWPSSYLQPLDSVAEFHSITDINITNNGFEGIVELEAPQSTAFSYRNSHYSLAQFHWHAPSEHTIDFLPLDFEMHMVFRTTEGRLLVLAVLFQQDEKGSDLIDKLWQFLPQTVGTVATPLTLNLRDVLPADRSYFHYRGSLTTPPCSEVVDWFILSNPVPITAAQVAKYKSILPSPNINARPTQPLQGRQIYLLGSTPLLDMEELRGDGHMEHSVPAFVKGNFVMSILTLAIFVFLLFLVVSRWWRTRRSQNENQPFMLNESL
eukprot:GILI01010233.1.p1 GENE.GILI01010233.1~~GILI01010233.1.p1  ORF type:complete len:341 (+),score=93.45 GILI01010233.1:100-1122(+)